MNIFKLIKNKKNQDKNNHVAEAKPITIKKIEKIIEKRQAISNDEFTKGYNLIKKYPRSVSVLGSARFKEGSEYYEKARSLTRKIASELGYAVVTGGGPGIMEAANRGAYEVGGVSLGFNIILPKEQVENPYLTEHVDFEYFFSRKTLLFFSAESYVYFPGGFGTLDEFFEIVTLIQTNKIPSVPVILVGKKFWEPVLGLIKEKLWEEFDTIDEKDTNIYKIVDDENEILEIIRKAPFRQE